jgi:putative endonuclease
MLNSGKGGRVDDRTGLAPSFDGVKKPESLKEDRGFAQSSRHPTGQVRLGAGSYDPANPFAINMYFVYFLLLKNRDIYKGSCDDIPRRMVEHNRGKVESTKNYLPVKLIGYEVYLLKSDAQRREKFLKTTEGRRLLRLQYRDMLEELSKEE